MGDRVTWQDNPTVAQYIWDDVAEQGNAKAPVRTEPHPTSRLRRRFPGRATESPGRTSGQSPNTSGMTSRSRAAREPRFGRSLTLPGASRSIIPLPFQVLFCSVFLIVELVQSVIRILFFPLPPIFRGSLGVINLIVVIVFLTFEGILSSLPLGVEPVESGVFRVFVILFRPVDRRSLTRLSWRLIDLGIILRLIRFAIHGSSRSRSGTEIDFHHDTLTATTSATRVWSGSPWARTTI